MSSLRALVVVLLLSAAAASGSTLIVFNPTCSATSVLSDVKCACSYASSLGAAPAECPAFSASDCSGAVSSRSILVKLTIIVRTCLVLKPGQIGDNMDPVLGNLTALRRLVAKLALVVTRGLVKPSVAPTYRRMVGDVRKERLARYNRVH
ncbi:hypothetical protein BWQ96_07414 [Gracilariopsis chorda]|uniref:Uncharacterized protein n=1 Tax=Gracilariopsis chorda TaxID=448386 RepID=A0A2V3IP17_9FLOR|nr:hypothetical protein BWQ96_07414 [Gracilariopsis chorda]|eukprot:PXF42870.1 hypothetical protein BWQ96_07414 [Gracilariopsis chorda]